MTAKQLLDQARAILERYHAEGRVPSAYLINHADFRTLCSERWEMRGGGLTGLTALQPKLFGVLIEVTEDREPYTRKAFGL